MVTPEVLLHAVRYTSYVADTKHEALPVVTTSIDGERVRPTAGLLSWCNAVHGPTSLSCILLDCPTTEPCSCCSCMFGLILLGQENTQGTLQDCTAVSNIQAANALLSSYRSISPWTSMLLMPMLPHICCCRCSHGVRTHPAADTRLVPAIL